PDDCKRNQHNLQCPRVPFKAAPAPTSGPFERGGAAKPIRLTRIRLLVCLFDRLFDRFQVIVQSLVVAECQSYNDPALGRLKLSLSCDPTPVALHIADPKRRFGLKSLTSFKKLLKSPFPVVMSLQIREFYEFGVFRLDPVGRRLLRGDGAVQLAPKAFEALMVLVEGRGRVLDRAELIRRGGAARRD